MSVSTRGGTSTVWPTTRWGRVGAGLFGGAAVFFAFFVGAAITGQTGGDTMPGNLWLFIPGVLSTACLVLSGVASGIAIFMRTERSVVVLLSLGISVLATLYELAEVGIPLLLSAFA